MANPQITPASEDACFVVGIGVSAGGIEALHSLLQAIPCAPALAIVIVQHSMPGQRDQLVRLLGRWTPLPVHLAMNGKRPAPNTVCVASSGDVLTLAHGNDVMADPAMSAAQREGGSSVGRRRMGERALRSGRPRAEEELRARNEELERFNRVSVGRELRMIDLKNEVNALRRQPGEADRYSVKQNDKPFA